MVEGGTAHGKKTNDQLVCLWGAPSPVYKGVEEGEGERGLSWQPLLSFH